MCSTFFVRFQATSLLVNGIKADAEGEDDDDSQKRLLAAAKVLADATAKLVEAAKVCVCVVLIFCIKSHMTFNLCRPFRNIPIEIVGTKVYICSNYSAVMYDNNTIMPLTIFE